MSGAADASAFSTMFSPLAPLLIGMESLWTHRFWSKANLQITDETTAYLPLRDGTQWGGTVVFSQPKRATLTSEYVLEVVISGSTLTSQPAVLTPVPNPPWAAANTPAAYVNCLGDQLIAQVTHRLGSQILHQYEGEYAQIYQRICVNEVNEQYRNAMILGGLPLSTVATPEQQRRQALVKGITVYVPLDRLWCSQNVDESWMPEAYATQGEIAIELSRLARVVYNATLRTGIGGTVPDPFVNGAPPTILSMRLFSREVILTVPEKMARLTTYESDRGALVHFLDCERQRRVTLIGTGGAGVRDFEIRLDNIRLDMQEIIFIVRRGFGAGTPQNEAALDDDWAGDPLQAPVYDFTVEGAPQRVTSRLGAQNKFIDVMLDDVVSFRLQAGGKRLFDDQGDLLDRTWVRRLYHPDSQPRDPIYIKSFSMAPEETKYVSGFQNAANLGNLSIVITMPDFAANIPRVVDVYVHSHNINQSRRGDSVKSLK